MNLTEAEDIKQRWQENTRTIPIRSSWLGYNDGVITHLEPEILECKGKCPSEATLWTKLVEAMEFQLSYFKSKKNDAVKVLHSICQQIIIEKAKEFQKNIYFCFIDYVKAFDCVDHNNLWKILTEMGISDHFICLLRNLYAGQETTVRTRHGTTDWFKIRKGVCQGCISSLCLFNIYAEYIMWNARLNEAQAGRIKKQLR